VHCRHRGGPWSISACQAHSFGKAPGSQLPTLMMAGTASTRAIWDAQARPRPVLRPCELRVKLGAQREVIMTGLDRVVVAWS